MADFPDRWMWSEACDMLAQAERMQRGFFRPTRSMSRIPVWEPPTDVIETEHEVLVLMALPGVDPEQVEAVIDNTELVVVGTRMLPVEFHTAIIHRLELPQGRFERRVRLPAGRYTSVQCASVYGCLSITLQKAEVSA